MGIGTTKKLRKLIKEVLDSTQGITFHNRADDDSCFPYKIYLLSGINYPDGNRDDYMLEVHYWDQGSNARRIEDISDEIAEILNAKTIPVDGLFPTFFKESTVYDSNSNEDTFHIIQSFLIQTYS